MRKRVFVWLLCIALLVPVLTVTVSADCAPKPTTSIDVMESRGRQIVVTLLAQSERHGPHSTIGKEESPEDWWDDLTEAEAEAWTAFRDYEDPDGFHFWGEIDWFGMDWTYYPPEVFKVAVYYPEYDALLVSEEVFERYAFHSDFRLFLDGADEPESGIVSMEVRRDYDWMEEVFGFLIRVVVTLAIELTVARFFGYSAREHMKVILLVNLVTQVGLNVLLSLWYIFDGPLDAMLRLVVAEILVLVVEVIQYRRKLPGRGKATWYAIFANLSSCILGWVLID